MNALDPRKKLFIQHNVAVIMRHFNVGDLFDFPKLVAATRAAKRGKHGTDARQILVGIFQSLDRVFKSRGSRIVAHLLGPLLAKRDAITDRGQKMFVLDAIKSGHAKGQRRRIDQRILSIEKIFTGFGNVRHAQPLFSCAASKGQPSTSPK